MACTHGTFAQCRSVCLSNRQLQPSVARMRRVSATESLTRVPVVYSLATPGCVLCARLVRKVATCEAASARFGVATGAESAVQV